MVIRKNLFIIQFAIVNISNFTKIMKKRVITTILILELILILVISIQLFTQFEKRKNSIPPSLSLDAHSTAERNRWKLYMQEVGYKKAYADFKMIYINAPFYIQHLRMHVIGELLYELDGIQGVKFCDGTYSYGCYHGFFKDAFEKKGLAQLQEADAVCLEKTGVERSGCRHGFGHVILEYFGNKNIVKALQTCDSLKQSEKTRGCKDGLFMEYNFNFARHTGAFKPRPVISSLEYSPCLALPDEYQHACYYALPEWWNSYYKNDFKKIDVLCQKVSNKNNKESCYLGAGDIAANSTFLDLEKTFEKCNIITSSQNNLLCKAGAYAVFERSNRLTSETEKLCQFNNSSLNTLCLQKSQLIKN